METRRMTRFSKLLMATAMTAVTAASGLPMATTAMASSCVNPAYVPIRIARGAYCWTYEGRGTHFTGSFRAGQRLQVQMSGLAYSGPGANASWTPRNVEVTAPGGIFISGNAPGRFDAILPRSGQYAISFGPCAMWHAFGRVVLCAR
jgi:hypothetical protein